MHLGFICSFSKVVLRTYVFKTRFLTFRIYNLGGEVRKKPTASSNMRESAFYERDRGRQDTGEI